MIQNLPVFISVFFALTTLLTLALFYLVIKKAHLGTAKVNYIFVFLILWLIVQATITLNSFYSTNTRAFPPKFFLLVLPPIIIILILFLNKRGRKFIDQLPMINITYLHVVRIPVEITLYWLYLHQAVPELMTFAGRNFDILAGLTAPLIAYFGVQEQALSRKTILIWNVVALALLLNIVINAVLSAPFRFQQFGFSQPNVAILYFPFTWLPGFIVPVVLFAHLVAIRKLLKSNS
jgi:hypothetical protein